MDNKDFQKWRKMPMDKLKTLEANYWFMIRECKNDSYVPKHSALRRFIARYDEFKREVSATAKDRQFWASLLRDIKLADKRKDYQTSRNLTMLFRIGAFISGYRLSE